MATAADTDFFTNSVAKRWQFNFGDNEAGWTSSRSKEGVIKVLLVGGEKDSFVFDSYGKRLPCLSVGSVREHQSSNFYIRILSPSGSSDPFETIRKIFDVILIDVVTIRQETFFIIDDIWIKSVSGTTEKFVEQMKQRSRTQAQLKALPEWTFDFVSDRVLADTLSNLSKLLQADT